MAKKKKRSDRASFLFDEGAGKSEQTIDLFGPDDDADEWNTGDNASDETGDASGMPKESDEPDPTERKRASDPADETDRPGATPSFRFDRYGRRIGKRKKGRYGKRKDAPKATTTIVEHDTEAKREYDQARARSEARAKKRAREEARQAAIRKAERKKRRQRSISTLLLTVLTIGFLLVMTWFVTRLQRINVSYVPDGYTEERIIALSGLEPKLKKRSALFISTRSVEKHINETDPYLDATVRYSFPSTVTITVSKRDEAACVRWGPQSEYLAIIDENGTVLNAAAESANGLLIADGMSISSAVNGTRLGDSSDIQVAALIRLLTKLKELGLLERTPRLSRIDMTELMQIRMYVEGMPYTIEVGDTTNLETKLMLLQKHWAEIMDEASSFIRSGYTTATIYLYSKGGVNISPYEAGHIIATPAPATPPPSSAPSDGSTEPTSGTDDTPDGETYTPAPQVTPMPHQGDPFTG